MGIAKNVTRDFFVQYKEKYSDLNEYLKKNDIFIEETKKMGLEVEGFAEQFAKKLMGQVAFLYFLRKGGQPGNKTLRKNENKTFVREIFDSCIDNTDKNFFKDYLEPFFYNTLNTKRKNHYYKEFGCKIPFLEGGLFEPIEGYHWENVNFRIPNKLFSNENADGILDVFDGFNFTISKNESSEKEGAVEPEMLGRIFEDLLEIKDRKSKGAFYTQEEVVQYMCRESLINYLVGKINVPYDDIKKFVLCGEPPENQDDKNGKKDTKDIKGNRSIPQSIHDNIVQIDDSLKNIRVADPAVGSGVFPLSMLNEIARIRNNITEYIIRKDREDAFDHKYEEIPVRKLRSLYRIKLETIKNCIFAMDIEPEAVDVTRLRLWLSLIAEQRIGDGGSESYLPDLDMNVYVGNSLIDGWESKFPGVFEEKGGFDIVIGNPPYIGEKGNKEIFRSITKTTFGKKYYQGKMDLFYFFFHKGIDICKDGGIIGFITTNYYTTADGAVTLRKDLKSRTDILKLVNFNEFKIFESALGQHNLITLLRKGNSERKSDTKIINVRKSGYTTKKELKNILEGRCNETDYFFQAYDKLFDGDQTYIRIMKDTDNILEPILNKISKGTKIDKICNVNQGIVSGADKLTIRHINKFGIKGQKGEGIFVLTEDEIKDKMFGPEEMELLKPFFKNSDISRYRSNIVTDKGIIYIDRGLRKINDKYPNIEKHLSKYYPILSQRRETRNGSIEYFHLNWGRNEKIFKGEKIVAPQRNKLNTFAYNNVSWYSSADVYYITPKDKNTKLKYLLGILNSKLYYIWFYYRGKRKGEMLELYQTPLKETPVVLSECKMNIMIELVEKMLNETKEQKIRSLQSDIDKLVYRIYKLDNSEIQWVEKHSYPS
ncbi:MAG: N-6 DNA methylase [Clostridiales bacterium]|nr:N-6 DNA methylase [Clostridiales bacterium]